MARSPPDYLPSPALPVSSELPLFAQHGGGLCVIVLIALSNVAVPVIYAVSCPPMMERGNHYPRTNRCLRRRILTIEVGRGGIDNALPQV